MGKEEISDVNELISNSFEVNIILFVVNDNMHVENNWIMSEQSKNNLKIWKVKFVSWLHCT